MRQDETTFASVFVLDGKGSAKIVDINRLTDRRMAKPTWIHLNLSRPEAIAWLDTHLSLHDWVKESLTDTEISEPHIRLRQNNVLLVIRSVNIMPDAEPDDLVFLRLFATKKLLVTTRLDPALDFAEMTELFSDKDGPKNIDELILAILENTLDSVSEAVAGIENQVDDLEEAVITGHAIPQTYPQLSEFLRQVIVIRRFMMPEREAVGNLIRRGVSWFQTETDRGMRDCFDWIQRIIEDIDLLEKRIRVNQDAIKNQEDTKTQRNMYMLTVIAGIFLPLSFLTGLFGMNLRGIPFETHPYGFITVCLLTGLIGLIVLFIFKKLKWI